MSDNKANHIGNEVTHAGEDTHIDYSQPLYHCFHVECIHPFRSKAQHYMIH